MKKLLPLIAIIIIMPIFCFSQNKTIELYKSGNVRREILYDEQFQILRETYFQNSNAAKKIATIDYKQNSEIKKFVGFNDNSKIDLIVDFENGTYDDYYLGNHLSFKNNFLFNGLQNNRIITINYKNGERDGFLLQRDSVKNGSKLGSTIGINRELLNYGVAKIERQYESIDTYKLYTSFKMSFKNDLLNGSQINLFPNGKIKMSSIFDNGKLISLKLINKDSSIISKINTEKGISASNYILNGKIINHNNDHIFIAYSMNNVGKIYSDLRSDTYHLEPGWAKESQDIGDGDPIEQLLYINNKTYHPCGKNQTFEKEIKIQLDKSLFEFKLNTLKAIIGIPRFNILTLEKNYLNNEFLIIGDVSKNNNMYYLNNIYFDVDEISSSELQMLPDTQEEKRKKEEKINLIKAYFQKVYN